jgi:hypothetical protein
MEFITALPAFFMIAAFTVIVILVLYRWVKP